MQQQSDTCKVKLSVCALLEVITGTEKHKGLDRNKKTPLTASMNNYRPPSKPRHIDLLARVKQVKTPKVQSKGVWWSALNTTEAYKETSAGLILKSKSFLTRNIWFPQQKYIYSSLDMQYRSSDLYRNYNYRNHVIKFVMFYESMTIKHEMMDENMIYK